MKIKSALVTQMSGSIGGMTGSHNQSGLYLRARSIPVNPNTTRQIIVRSALTQLITRWTETLTPAQRAGWDTYATNVPVTNPLGDPIKISGQNWYVAANTSRLQINAVLTPATPLLLVDDAPVIFDRGDFETPVIASVGVAAGYSVTFNNTDAWANEDDSAMIVYQALPVNPSRNFFKGPFRAVDVIPGDAITPPTSPFVITNVLIGIADAFPLVVGQSTRLDVLVVRADGRVSTRRMIGPETVGA